ncbi:Zinc finger, BED-type [Quillaja saponaria]|uniref:Zinc finger, BED-type n=1 Tax=Quillaja saponaria TaxID=32244 RepID=A0AAD7M3F7_QUISA|nr:Zinc finger, BED-type [Quillaja saponaria]
MDGGGSGDDQAIEDNMIALDESEKDVNNVGVAVATDKENKSKKNTSKKRKKQQASSSNSKQPANAKIEAKVRNQINNSWVWEYYTHVEGTSGIKRRSRCNFCGVTYASHTKNNGTSNLACHLKFKCKKFPKHLLPN